jgi:hypothetical protein
MPCRLGRLYICSTRSHLIYRARGPRTGCLRGPRVGVRPPAAPAPAAEQSRPKTCAGAAVKTHARSVSTSDECLQGQLHRRVQRHVPVLHSNHTQRQNTGPVSQQHWPSQAKPKPVRLLCGHGRGSMRVVSCGVSGCQSVRHLVVGVDDVEGVVGHGHRHRRARHRHRHRHLHLHHRRLLPPHTHTAAHARQPQRSKAA